MNTHCGYCGGTYEQDRCPDCGRQRGALPHPFITLGPGRMGNYRTLAEAQALIANYADSQIGPLALFVRADVAVAWGMNARMLEVHDG